MGSSEGQNGGRTPGAEGAHPAARAAAELAQRMLDADVGLIEGARVLCEQLRGLGEYAGGDFSGPFAALTYFVFETDPYPSESERASCSEADRAQADRWLPTIFGNHREKVLEVCRGVVAKYGALGAAPPAVVRADPAVQSRLADGSGRRDAQEPGDAPDHAGRLRGEGGSSAALWRGG